MGNIDPKIAITIPEGESGTLAPIPSATNSRGGGRDWGLYWTAAGALSGFGVLVLTSVLVFGVRVETVPFIVYMGFGCTAGGAGVGALVAFRITSFSGSDLQTRTRARWACWAAILLGVALVLVGAADSNLSKGAAGAGGSGPTTSNPGSSPQASLAPVIDLPAGFIGTWKGSARPFDPRAQDFALEITLRAGQVGSVIGTFTAVGCDSEAKPWTTLKLESVASDRITLSVCTYWITMSVKRDDQADVNLIENGKVSATATLVKTA